MRRALFILITLSSVCPACSSEFGPDTAEELLLTAIEVPNSLLNEVTNAGADISPKTMSSLPFSMLILSVKMDPETESLKKHVSSDGSGPGPIWREGSSNHRTLFPEGTLSEVTVAVTGDQATGTFRFRREGWIEGRAAFKARKVLGGWEVFEISLPDLGAGTALDADGNWKGTWPE